MKRLGWMLGLLLPALLCGAGSAATEADPAGACMVCHKEASPGLYNQWKQSAHGQHNVTCISCHGAEQAEVDAYFHHGAWIATLVTPKDCGTCHEKETKEVDQSYHATAGLIAPQACLSAKEAVATLELSWRTTPLEEGRACGESRLTEGVGVLYVAARIEALDP